MNFRNTAKARSYTVYHYKKALLAENIGYRLENFFWRLWSSERVRQRLGGQKIAIQFSIINEGGFIRTTPTNSPRSSKSLTTYYREAGLRTPPTTPPLNNSTRRQSTTSSGSARSPNQHEVSGGPERADPVADSSQDASSSSEVESTSTSRTPTPTSPFPPRGSTVVPPKENRRAPPSKIGRPPPILKKEGSSGSSRSSRSVTTTARPGESGSGNLTQSEDAVSSVDDPLVIKRRNAGASRRQNTTRFNEEVAVSIPKFSPAERRGSGERLTKSSGENSQKGARKNPTVVASSGSSKRPVVMRQKSNTGSPKDSPLRTLSSQSLSRSPRFALSTKATPGFSDQGPASESEPKQARKARAASPHPSRERKAIPLGNQKRRQSEEAESSPSSEQGPDSLATPGMVEETKPSSTSGTQSESSKPLVDPDFRTKFIRKTQGSQRSFTDLSLLSKKSSAATPTAASYNATGILGGAQSTLSTGRGLGRESFTNVTAPLKAPAPAGPQASTASDEISANPEEAAAAVQDKKKGKTPKNTKS